MRALGGFDRNGGQAMRAIFGRRGAGRRRFLQPVDLLDEHEDDEGNDDEVKRGLKEDPVVDSGGSRSLGCRERGLGCAGQINE